MHNILIKAGLTIGVKELAKILHKSEATILRDLSHPERRLKLPPLIPTRMKGDKPLWYLPTVLAFLGGELEKIVIQIQIILNGEAVQNFAFVPEIPTLAESLKNCGVPK